MPARAYTFIGGSLGDWDIVRIDAVAGEGLPAATCLEIRNAAPSPRPPDARWTLSGIVSHERYVRRREREALVARQPALGRTEASCAALIPISKSAAWWALAQDERREIFEERSRHIEAGLGYLPAIARRLHHGRDLGESFDFLTWFEYAPQHAIAFEELVALLRATEEWKYVEREVDIRLIRNSVP